MKRTILFAIVCCLMQTAQAAEKTEAVPEYTITCAGTGIEGTWLVEVAIMQKKTGVVKEENLRAAALHGVLFRGVAATAKCGGYRPIVRQDGVEEKNREFFASLFGDGAKTLRYADVVNGSVTVVRTGKKDFRITATVSVKKDDLRHLLEDNKIIEGMGDMF